MVNRFHKYRQIKQNDPKGATAIAKRLFLFVFGAFLSASLCLVVDKAQFGLENYMYAQISQPAEADTRINIPVSAESSLGLEAKSAYSLRIGVTGREKIIYRNNYDDVCPIASLTKLMTATVVLEHPEIYPLDRQVTVSEAAASQYDVPVFGNLTAGETYTVGDLLHLMLFYSSNDAAWALADVMGEPEFTAAMNAKSKELGLANTEFYNPNGLDCEDGTTNHSSASDLILLSKYIIQNHPEVLDYSVKPGPYLTENGIFDLKFWNGNVLVGGKTGFTEKAGGCMVVVFKDASGRQYINVVLGAASPESRVAQMQKLINYTNNFSPSLAQTK